MAPCFKQDDLRIEELCFKFKVFCEDFQSEKLSIFVSKMSNFKGLKSTKKGDRSLENVLNFDPDAVGGYCGEFVRFLKSLDLELEPGNEKSSKNRSIFEVDFTGSGSLKMRNLRLEDVYFMIQ